jgi:hypothetical protein
MSFTQSHSNEQEKKKKKKRTPAQRIDAQSKSLSVKTSCTHPVTILSLSCPHPVPKKLCMTASCDFVFFELERALIVVLFPVGL